MSDQIFHSNWVTSAKAGNHQAIENLYICAWQEVSIVIRTMIRTDNDAVQDLVQDTFLKAFNRLDQLDDPAKYHAWIKQIARNTALDYLKKSKAILFSELYDDDSIPIEIEDEDLSHLPDVALDKQEAARLLHEILDSLPQMQRTVISMHYLQEIPVKEIAAILGRSENTIKVQLHKGRKNLEQKIRELEQKEDIKLYSLSPLPFLLLLLRNAESMPAQPDMGMLGDILQTGATSGTAGTAAADSAARSSSIFSKSLLGKLTAGIASAALLTGAVVVYFSSNGSNTVIPTETTVQAVETTMQTIETTVHEEDDNPYSELISDYSDVIRGEAPASSIPMNPDRFGYSCTPFGSYINGEGYFVVRADIDYAFALYDINGDGVKELFVFEGAQTTDGKWDGPIADIFTFHNGQPVLLISGEERGRVSICENGYILKLGSGGADAHDYSFHEILEGELILCKYAEEAWGTYTINGTVYTESEFYRAIEQYTIVENIDFEILEIVDP
jgi:RNA polymerase sigma factor (sigma-70 family)